ncbi:transcriptional regulator [Xanthomonas citri pv. mangiferaeindicae]|nr:transcriptional regulator [Xanthomonas citri pv. mangiferaeindicae]
MTRLQRARPELSSFLRTCRARLSPGDVGLQNGGRRRTPGLRREEVAALAGVGLSWYTWLEQGRDIGVSSTFLDNLARVLQLDAAERRHLYLLAHARPPAEPGRTFCQVPPLVRRLMDDLAPHAVHVLNLRWDVLAFNAPADALFGFGAHPPERRNLLWLLFADEAMRTRLVDWDVQARAMLSSFRRDYARGAQDVDAQALVESLRRVSPEFAAWWAHHDAGAPCSGERRLCVDGVPAPFEHTMLTIDEERHLRMVVHARRDPVAG